MPLYTLWQTGSASDVLLFEPYCTAGDLLIGSSALLASLLLFGTAERPATAFSDSRSIDDQHRDGLHRLERVLQRLRAPELGVFRLDAGRSVDRYPDRWLLVDSPKPQCCEAPPAMKKTMFDTARSLVLFFAVTILTAAPAIAKSHGTSELLNGYFASEDLEYGRAIGHYSRAIESDSLSLMQMSDAYRARGDAQFFLQRIHRALDDYNLALHLNPRNAPALNNRGNALYKEGSV